MTAHHETAEKWTKKTDVDIIPFLDKGSEPKGRAITGGCGRADNSYVRNNYPGTPVIARARDLAW